MPLPLPLPLPLLLLLLLSSNTTFALPSQVQGGGTSKMLLRGGSAIYIDTIHHKYSILVDTMVTDSDKDRAPHSPIPTGGAQKRGASSGHAFTMASVSRGMPPIELGPAAARAPPY